MTPPTKALVLTPAQGSDWVCCRVCNQPIRAHEAFAIVGARVAYICREPRVIFVPEHRTLPACADALIKSKTARTISILEVKARSKKYGNRSGSNRNGSLTQTRRTNLYVRLWTI
jgi:hypothetical protein